MIPIPAIGIARIADTSRLNDDSDICSGRAIFLAADPRTAGVAVAEAGIYSISTCLTEHIANTIPQAAKFGDRCS